MAKYKCNYCKDIYESINNNRKVVVTGGSLLNGNNEIN